METQSKIGKDVKQHTGAMQNEVVIQRVFSLPAWVVWAAWTDAEIFKKWWGPEGFTCPFSEMEARVGGKYLNCMRGPDGKEYWSTGVVKEFIAEKKLVITDHFSDKDGNIKNASEHGLVGNWPEELLITVTMEEADGATKLKLLHEGIPAEMHDECLQGWNESLDKLEKNIK